MDVTTRVKEKNVYRFLLTFAKDISTDDLEPIHRPFSPSIVFYYGNDRDETCFEGDHVFS